jgi:hypothetical protein
MAFIHNGSSECSKHQLDMFALPTTQLSVEYSEKVVFKPIASIENESPIEFSIPAAAEEYTDLSQTYLKLVVSIVDETGLKITDTDVVGPVNNLMHSLFSDVSLAVGSKVISSPSHMYQYRAYLEALYNSSTSHKETHQTQQLYFKDTSSYMNNIGIENTGMTARKAFTDKGKKVALKGKINIDLFGQSKFLINGVSLSLIFTRSKPSFNLMTTAAKPYKIKIHSASLEIRRIKISPNILIAQTKVLNSVTSKYPINRVEVKSFTIPAGSQITNIDNAISGQLPVRLIVGFVLNSALSGNYKQNPFNFQHFSLNYIALTGDGAPVNGKPLTPQFSGDNVDYLDSYNSTLACTGINSKENGYGISLIEYVHGYTLHAWDLTSDCSADSHQWNLRRNGTLGLELHFESSLTDTISCIVYAEFHNLIEIDKDRRVTTDY